MPARKRNILILFVVLLVSGWIYLLSSFFTAFSKNALSAFAPDEITISNSEIVSSRGFINPVTIEKLKVDSIGEDQRPVKYEIEYLATCAIKQTDGKPPVPLKKIELVKPGRYYWSEEKVSIPITHIELSRKRMDSIQGIIWSTGNQHFDICPIKFESGNWYFVTFLDPQIVGAYIFIGKNGKLQQFMTYSGVSPI